MTVEQSEFPLLSIQMSVIRERLRREIANEQEAGLTLEQELAAIEAILPHQVEIMGLELLQNESDDDSDCESYAEDSKRLAMLRLNRKSSGTRKGRFRAEKRLSVSSDVSVEPEVGGQMQRRSSLGSYAANSIELNHHRISMTSTRSERKLELDFDDLSLGSYESESETESLDYGYGPMPQSYMSQNSIGGYSDFANNSVKMRSRPPVTKMDHAALKSTTSIGSHSFAPEIIETQKINTGGFNRAA